MNHIPTISAVLITRNEEHNLTALLPQLDWTDEIVVVDSGSHDATVAVARAHACRFVSRRFETFARQRNHALRLARGTWVFSIDADERPTAKLIAEIRRVTVHGRAAAYRVPIRSKIFGRPLRFCGTQDDCPIRLFRRRRTRFAGDVHEVPQVAGRIGRMQHWLTHETSPNLQTFLAKMHQYAHLEARACLASGQTPRRHAAWTAPAYEFLRRFVYKRGFFDGPAGWAFCLLSGLSEWVLAREHRRLALADNMSETPRLKDQAAPFYEATSPSCLTVP